MSDERCSRGLHYSVSVAGMRSAKVTAKALSAGSGQSEGVASPGAYDDLLGDALQDTKTAIGPALTGSSGRSAAAAQWAQSPSGATRDSGGVLSLGGAIQPSSMSTLPLSAQGRIRDW